MSSARHPPLHRRIPEVITEPLGFQRLIQIPPRRLDTAPWIDLVLLALFFSLQSSRFLMAPGLGIELAESTGKSLSGAPAIAVLTILPTPVFENQSTQEPVNRFLLGNELFVFNQLRSKLEKLGDARDKGYLLIKADASIPLQQLARILDEVQAAGIGGAQLAIRSQLPTLAPPLLLP